MLPVPAALIPIAVAPFPGRRRRAVRVRLAGWYLWVENRCSRAKEVVVVDVHQDEEAAASAGPDPRRRRRRAWLYASTGVVLAFALAAVLLSATSGNRGASGVTTYGSPTLPGVNSYTTNLLSLAVLPSQQPKPAPDFRLTDQNGQPVSLSQFRGKSVVLSFNDDQCTDVCTLLAEDIVRADRYLGPRGAGRVVFLAVNVNPFFPQARYVKQWSDNNDLGHIPNWYFGTSTPAALRAIWNEYGVYVGTDAQTRTVTHSSLIEYIGPNGHIRATGDFGQSAVDVAPYSHGMAQTAVDLLPGPQRVPVAGPQAPKPSGTGAGLGQQAPSFSLGTVNGAQTVSLAGLAGSPVVLNFWASTCQDCRAELSAFSQIAKADPKVRFIGIDVADPSPATALLLARSAGISYPVLDDRDGKVAAAYRVGGLPTTVYVNSAGRIDVVHPGAMTAEQLRYTLAQFFPNHTPQGG